MFYYKYLARPASHLPTTHYDTRDKFQHSWPTRVDIEGGNCVCRWWCDTHCQGYQSKWNSHRLGELTWALEAGFVSGATWSNAGVWWLELEDSCNLMAWSEMENTHHEKPWEINQELSNVDCLVHPGCLWVMVLSVQCTGIFDPGQDNERKHIDDFKAENCRQDVVAKRRFVHRPKVVYLFEKSADK